jgi:hypothetical protein
MADRKRKREADGEEDDSSEDDNAASKLERKAVVRRVVSEGKRNAIPKGSLLNPEQLHNMYGYNKDRVGCDKDASGMNMNRFDDLAAPGFDESEDDCAMLFSKQINVAPPTPSDKRIEGMTTNLHSSIAALTQVAASSFLPAAGPRAAPAADMETMKLQLQILQAEERATLAKHKLVEAEIRLHESK